MLLPAVFLHDRRGALEPGDAKRLAQWLYSRGVRALQWIARNAPRCRRERRPTLRAQTRLGDLIRMAQEPRTPGSD